MSEKYFHKPIKPRHFVTNTDFKRGISFTDYIPREPIPHQQQKQNGPKIEQHNLLIRISLILLFIISSISIFYLYGTKWFLKISPDLFPKSSLDILNDDQFSIIPQSKTDYPLLFVINQIINENLNNSVVKKVLFIIIQTVLFILIYKMILTSNSTTINKFIALFFIIFIFLTDNFLISNLKPFSFECNNQTTQQINPISVKPPEIILTNDSQIQNNDLQQEYKSDEQNLIETNGEEISTRKVDEFSNEQFNSPQNPLNTSDENATQQLENQTESIQQTENQTESIKQTESIQQTENQTESIKQTESIQQTENQTESIQQTENETESIKQIENQTESIKQMENETESIKQIESNSNEYSNIQIEDHVDEFQKSEQSLNNHNVHQQTESKLTKNEKSEEQNKSKTQSLFNENQNKFYPFSQLIEMLIVNLALFSISFMVLSDNKNLYQWIVSMTISLVSVALSTSMRIEYVCLFIPIFIDLIYRCFNHMFFVLPIFLFIFILDFVLLILIDRLINFPQLTVDGISLRIFLRTLLSTDSNGVVVYSLILLPIVLMIGSFFSNSYISRRHIFFLVEILFCGLALFCLPFASESNLYLSRSFVFREILIILIGTIVSNQSEVLSIVILIIMILFALFFKIRHISSYCFINKFIVL